MKKYIKYLMLLAVFAVIPTVSAKEVEHFTSKIDNSVVIEETYNASVAAAGENVHFDGNVKGVSFGASNKLEFSGESDYAALAGNVIEVNGKIVNDIVIAGNLVTINKDANIGRDAIIAAADVEISGNFERNISIYASKVTFKNATIKGHVKVYSNQIQVEKGTTILGSLSYPEDSIYKADKEAKIGKVEKTEAIKQEDDENFFTTVSAKIWSFLCLALIFATITLIFPNLFCFVWTHITLFTKLHNKYEKIEAGEVIEVFTKGLVALILVPIIIILLFCTLIGIPLAIILLLFYGIAIYLSTIFAAYLIGYKIWQKVFDKDINMLGLGLIGLFILLICSLIPGVRTLVSILTTIIGLGLIVEVIKKKN